MTSRRFFAVFGAAALLLQPFAAQPGTTSYPQSVSLPLTGSGITLTIKAGSQSDTLSIGTTSFTVTVAAGESFTVSYPGPNPGTLTNDGGIASCAIVGSDNEATVSATGSARTVTFTPTTALCGAGSGGGSGTSGPPPATSAVVTIAQPNGGQVLDVDAEYLVIWSVSGQAAAKFRLLLSTDSGSTFPTVLGETTANVTSFVWKIGPTATKTARLRVQAFDGAGTVLSSDDSDANFEIFAPAALPADLVPAPTITEDKTLPPTPETKPPCVAGSLIRPVGMTPVYYCGADGKRYVFTNEKVYFSWYKDFSGVVAISPAAMAAIRIGGNVTYKPGSRLVKIVSDPRVYAVSKGGVLRWVPSEAVAGFYFGSAWAKLIDDIPDSFFFSYTIGAPLTLP
jgi:hypothetical protein